MSSLKDDFNEVLRRIRHGREFTHSSFEPIYYLVFPPEKILEVKRNTPAWFAKLQNDGWEVTVFSIAQHVLEILKSAPMRKVWRAADTKHPPGLGQDKPIARQRADKDSSSPVQAGRNAHFARKKPQGDRIGHRPRGPASLLANWRDRGTASEQIPCPDGISLSWSPYGQNTPEVPWILSRRRKLPLGSRGRMN